MGITPVVELVRPTAGFFPEPEEFDMACRVGMSTDPQERIQYWMREEGHTHWEILASGLTYSAAQKREKREAENRGCRYHPGGIDNGMSNWSVYHVWGGR